MKDKIPIIVVNLKKDTSKKKRIARILSDLNLKFDFLDAIDGGELSPKELNLAYNSKRSKSQKKRKLTKGEIGATLSHLKICQKILDEDIDKMIVLEDDAVLNKNFLAALDVIKYLPENWELFLLGYSAGLSNSLLCNDYIVNTNNSSNFRIGIPVKIAGGNYGYVLNKRGAKRLLSYKESLYQVIDYYTGDYHLTNVYTIYPRVVGVDFDLGSGINVNSVRTQSIFNSRPKWLQIISKNLFLYKIAKKIDCIQGKLKFRVKGVLGGNAK